jgi:subtilisin family serine protease
MKAAGRSCRSVAALALAGALLGAWQSAAAAQPQTWNFTQAAIPDAQPLGHYGKGVLVAVVDTWIDFHDTEFGGRVVEEADCVGSNGTAGSCKDNTYAPDACTHGTHVAGTVASTDYGVAPEADVLAVQVLSYDSATGGCDGSAQDVAAGIGFAVAKGARVINLSLGDLVPLIFQSSQITTAIDSAAAAGVVVVVAAGNSSLPFTDNYGANAIMVAATGPSGQLASYSDSFVLPQGAVGLAAPGGDTGSNASCSEQNCILSTLPGNKLGLMEGTSMAAPHVSGTAALLISQDPSRSRSNVLQTLASTARPLSGAGDGLLDATAALRAGATTTSPSASGPPPARSGATSASTQPATPAANATPSAGSGIIPSASAPAPAPGSAPPSAASPTTSTTTAPTHVQPTPVASPASRKPGTSWDSRHSAALAAAVALLAAVVLSSALLIIVRARGG